VVKRKLVFTPQARKDAKKLTRAGLTEQAQPILDLIETNPFEPYPPYEKLVGDLAGAFPAE